MALKTFLELRQEVGENLSIIDVNGIEAFDATTSPTLTRVNQYINDTIREVVSDFPYSNQERTCYLPFYHTIPNVPSAELFNASGSSVTVTPFPDVSALQAGCVTLEPNYNFSGISATFPVGEPQVSVSGSQTSANYNTVGYMYELPAKVDQIYALMIPEKGIKLQFVPVYDLNRVLPQGVWTSSGTTPTWYTEHNGMSPNGNKMIEFYPSPAVSLSGTNFLLSYKNKQVDMTADDQLQNIFPDQFQDIIIHGALEKSYNLINDQDKTAYHRGLKEARVMQLRKWSENQPDYVNKWRDMGGSSMTSGPVGVDLATGWMINGYGQ